MTQPKKLIEVAMPIKEISAESVRDKSIRQGHISTLHLWWARRPLPVCRAVVFASLVPDPLDEFCPRAFKDAVQLLLGKQENNTDPYKPYDDIPYTSAIDKMEDNLRNRLMMFIGKFSDKYIQNEKLGTTTNAKDQLSGASLIKWDNKNDEKIIGKARKLIWVAHNSTSGKTAKDLLSDFDNHYKATKDAEHELYSVPDRHINTDAVKTKEATLHSAIEAFLDKMPKVFDPFAGGGAIPLEAARLGCRSYGNDINPVAHFVEIMSATFPQMYGKSIVYSKEKFIDKYGLKTWEKASLFHKNILAGEAVSIKIANQLSFDVEFYGKLLLEKLKSKTQKLYGESNEQPIGYLWAYRAKCSNPSCRSRIPLISSFTLCNKISRPNYINPVIDGKNITFNISSSPSKIHPFVKSKQLECPICGNITNDTVLKEQFQRKEVDEILFAVIDQGKKYRTPTKRETAILNNIEIVERPSEPLVKGDSKSVWITLWGFSNWSDLYNDRQMLSVIKLTEALKEISIEIKGDENYKRCLITYLAGLINRIASRLTRCSIWNTTAETLEIPFGNKTVPLVFDYMESNPLSSETGGGSSQIEWITKYIESESICQFPSFFHNSSSGNNLQFKPKEIDAVITDPPYYDAIGYGDLSDLFYVWFKRTLTDLYPLNFSTPLTPKTDECTALKHHHNGNKNAAKKHFEEKLTQIFTAIEIQTKDIISIMFAHQSTEAWTTLCNSILRSSMNITGSWAIDTERTSGTKVDKAFLSSSVTVSCKPILRGGFGEYKEVKKAIEKTVAKEVNKLYHLGFRGADLLTACFGQAVSEFGKYEKVEKSDGTEVTVADLLKMAKESAFNALLKGFEGDDFTKFYIGWLQLYAFAESEFDDAAKLSRVGLSINVQDLFTENILIKNGNKQTLGGYQERLKANKHLGAKTNSYLIDQVHKALSLFSGSRGELLKYIAKTAENPDSSFWRVVTSLCEVLPAGSEDHKQATGLLANKDSLIRDSKTVETIKPEQGALFNA